MNNPPPTWVSQFDLADTLAEQEQMCFEAAKEMTVSTRPGEPRGRLGDRDDRIQIAIGGADHVGRIRPDPKAAAAARNYVDKLLDKGLRVLVGVSYGNGLTRKDATKHYVSIYGRAYESDGRLVYLFKDPGTRLPQYAEGRFYVDKGTNKFFRVGRAPKSPLAVFNNYEVTHVRLYRDVPP